MIATELNTAVSAKLIDSGFTDLMIMPLIGYDDSVPPFMTFTEYVSTRSVEQFWLRQSTLIYYVYDNDISRSRDLVDILDTFLNKGDFVDEINAAITTTPRSNRLAWCRLSSGGMFPAIEREGFTSITRSFEIGYIEE